MAEPKSNPVKQGQIFKPQQECPPETQDEHCEGTITGTIQMPCCCPKLYSRTWPVSLGPQTEAQLAANVAGTANAYEAAGYIVLAHSLVDTGAGWQLFLTVGWYA